MNPNPDVYDDVCPMMGWQWRYLIGIRSTRGSLDNCYNTSCGMKIALGFFVSYLSR